MENKIFLFAFYLAVMVGSFFVLGLVDELLPANIKSVSVQSLYTDASEHRSIEKDYFMILENGLEFQITHVEYSNIKVHNEISVAYTPIFNDAKDWKGNRLPNGKQTGNPDFDKPRSLFVIYSVFCIILSIVAIRAKKFEFRVPIAFFLMVFSAVKFWLIHTLK